LKPWALKEYGGYDEEKIGKYTSLHRFFTLTNLEKDAPDAYEACVRVIDSIAPKAYAPGKKKSRIFMAICKALGIADDTAGSQFQKDFAILADELSAKRIDFKLFISINPAHFLTMSNPRDDERGCTLTSCHSLNSTEYDYNNGCSGYARDKVSFIVFTVEDPTNLESLNNRKTTRQIFAYEPGNGVLLQSRMYNTSGGVYGAAEESKTYRDLVQRELSALEDKPNLWKTKEAVGSNLIRVNEHFGGYPDWNYSQFDCHVSVRKGEDPEPIEVGEYGLCISCGRECESGLYCKCCDDREQCEDCEEYYDSDDLYTVWNRDGEEVRVCQDCLDNHYRLCAHCGEYHDIEECEWIECVGEFVCSSCLEEFYEPCAYCGEWHEREDMYEVNPGTNDEKWVCGGCIDDCYYADCCGEYYDEDYIYRVMKANGDEVCVCPNCKDDYEECSHCHDLVEACADGTCPSCGELLKEEEEKEEEEKEEEEKKEEGVA
jgi:hypothetical protein